ncbi:protein disulfide [Biscogniauxia mediterranea]|nr:protein disulfide [Biscogniauxia mediterranea]
MSGGSHKLVVEFFYDIVCPFAYIASTRIEAIAAQESATVIWRPVLLGGIYKATQAPQGADGSATDAFNPAKKAVFGRAFARSVKRLGIPLKQPAQHPRKTIDALRLLHYLPSDARVTVTHAFFKAYWVDEVHIADRDVLLDIARLALGKMPAAQALLTPALFDDQQPRQFLERATADAIERGAPGVPGFWIPGETWQDSSGNTRQGRLYWGQDRMHFVQASLMRLNGDVLSVRGVPMLRDLIPRCRKPTPLHEPVKLEFWFDFASPWAYIGWTRLESLRRRFGNQLEIELKPILLGALFKEIGAPLLPLSSMSEQRRRYYLQDMHDWVKFWNDVDRQEDSSREPTGFRWPDVFPIRSPTLLRCAIADPSCISALYRACWVLNLDVSKEDVLKSVLAGAGFDAEHVLAQARTPANKEVLFTNTKMAVEAGFCGVPTYRVFRREPSGTWKPAGGFVWGQDETAVVEDLIAGWDENSAEVVQRPEEMTITGSKSHAQL